MRLLAPLLILGVALAVLVLTPAGARICRSRSSGLCRGRRAGRIARLCPDLDARSRSRADRRLRGAIWATLLVVLTGVYAYRFDAADFLGRVAAELMPSEPQVGQGGEVIVSRRLERRIRRRGESERRAGDVSLRYRRVNGRAAPPPTQDAPASTLAGLTFDVPVTTANGAALAAEVRLNEIAVGPIVMRNVGALVARPGALEESLLGMSFLERLKSYTVERGRLILTAK